MNTFSTGSFMKENLLDAMPSLLYWRYQMNLTPGKLVGLYHIVPVFVATGLCSHAMDVVPFCLHFHHVTSGIPNYVASHLKKYSFLSKLFDPSHTADRCLFCELFPFS